MLTIKHFAEFFDISYFTVWEWIKKGIIEDYERKGSQYYINKDEFCKKILEAENMKGMDRFMFKKIQTKIIQG
ncbi:MAG: helix-turn-helix domain-containing protein [Melioribacteraceae bacterium]|jgi:predicted site-specific integrase-resolvase|nr:helix-turn-helix domain-containing protein [Melioribacteraceae bacterium]MDD3982803.1 helix-turn-helix domain-containing protein [Candidatus Omnitrophota bacterium]